MISLGLDCPKERDCLAYIEKWGSWCISRQDLPMAMLPISPRYNDIIDAKSRNMIVKSARHYYYQVFDYNHHLDEIFAINTSTSHRQGKPMSPAYTTRPEPIRIPYQLCNTQHRYVHLGGFDDSHTLKAYCALAIVGEVAIINTILGHCDALPNGVMNGLIDYINSYLRRFSGVQYLNYLDMINCGEGLSRFKRSVGFRSMEVHFDY